VLTAAKASNHVLDEGEILDVLAVSAAA